MSCNYYNGKCVFLNGKVYEEGCIACPIKRAYNKGVRDTKKDYKRPHGEWKHDKFGDFFKSVLCSNCGLRSALEFPFCPNCGAPMTEEAFRKYNGLKEGEAK